LIQLPRLKVRQYAFKDGGCNALEWETVVTVVLISQASVTRKN
jgi:hypothetical protein